MENLTKIDEINLSKIIDKWFDENIANIELNKNFWRRNPVAKVLKDRLKQIKRFKNGPRRNLVNNLKSKKELNNMDW